jgi:phage terminase large subunit-like protein
VDDLAHVGRPRRGQDAGAEWVRGIATAPADDLSNSLVAIPPRIALVGETLGQARSLVVDRAGIRVLRDPYSAKPYVLIYTTKRVGGGVQDFDAIKLLKFGAS